MTADKLSVQIHIQDTGADSPYRDVDRVAASMQYLGISHFRCAAPQVGKDSYRKFVAMASMGMTAHFTTRDDPVKEIGALIAYAAQGGTIATWEGPNEPDLNPVSYAGFSDKRLAVRNGSGAGLIAYINAMHAAVIAHRADLPDLHIVNSNDWMQAQQKGFGSYANSHIYPNGNELADRLPAFRALVKASGHGQGFITECGWSTAVGTKGASNGVTEQAQADHIVKAITAAQADPKVALLSIYDLFDYSDTTPQNINHFGLFRADGTPKPVADAVRALLIP